MGGLLILLVRARRVPRAQPVHDCTALTVLFVTLGCGAIGFLDDFIKLTHRRSLGLPRPLEDAAARADHRGRRPRRLAPPAAADRVYIPVVGDVPLSYAWYGLLFLVIAGAANGVNLTDGLDGLAAGTGIIALFTFTAMIVISWIRSGSPGHRFDTEARPGDRRRGADRGADRLPLVQRLPGRGVHGRHRLDGDRRRARRRSRS